MIELVIKMMLCALLVFSVSVIQAANILVVLPFPAPSHFYCFYPLIQELKNRGHNMTIVTPIKFEDEGFNHIDLPGVQKHFLSSWAELRSKPRLTMMLSIFEVAQKFTRGSLTHANFQNLIHSNNTHFDLIMIELYYTDAYLALAQRFNAPVVGLVPQTLPTAISWSSTNPILFSYIPVMYLPYSNRMSFLERTLNTIFGMAHLLTYELDCFGFHQQTVHSQFSFLEEGQKNVKSMINDISLTLVNSHYTMGYPRPYLPNMVEVAGLHLKQPKPLPKNLQDFMDAAKHGVVYISFGTMVDPAIVNDWTSVILEVFSPLPIQVMWKWKADLMQKIPENFLIQDWFPQNDILNHPNCKLFLTHGGIHSVIESINAAVPVLGLPFFSEQPYNIAIMENLGIGLGLKNIELNELKHAVDKVLNQTSFAENMNRRSQLFKDRLVDPLNTSVFWIEHVIRHKGASHLKSSAMELPWYQLFLVDVFSFLITISAAILYAAYVLARGIISCGKRGITNLPRCRSLQTSATKTNKHD